MSKEIVLTIKWKEDLSKLREKIDKYFKKYYLYRWKKEDLFMFFDNIDDLLEKIWINDTKNIEICIFKDWSIVIFKRKAELCELISLETLSKEELIKFLYWEMKDFVYNSISKEALIEEIKNRL